MLSLKHIFNGAFRFLFLPEQPWSPARRKVIFGVAFSIWLIFAVVGPGLDYFGCYTWMVTDPARLAKVADYPWTLNPPWLNLFMAPFITLPGKAGYILFMAVMLGAVIYGAYKFRGNALLTLLSSQMFWILWWGQLEGWGVLGFVFGWIAVDMKSWPLMFLALTLASFKPQVGFIPVLALWWWSGGDRWKSMAALFALFIASLFIWGPWPVWYLQGIPKYIGDQHFAILNASIGWAAIPLFLPALLVRLDRKHRLIALTATTLLASPYMPYYSTILLLCLEIPWWIYPLAFLGYFTRVIGTTLAWNAIGLIPAGVLVWLYLPYLRRWLASRRSKPLSPSGVA